MRLVLSGSDVERAVTRPSPACAAILLPASAVEQRWPHRIALKFAASRLANIRNEGAFPRAR